jgi:hydroxymethylglutaryl-CoA lyase
MIATDSELEGDTAAEYRLRRMTLEGTHSATGELPQVVSIREVGPRDGFQNEPEVIPTERKIELIDALARTGLRRLEATSFVRADVIPQLADAAQVLAGIDVPADVSVSVLIPNERGLDAALELRERVGAGARRGGGAGGRDDSAERPAFDEINVFMSASETHNRKNVNRSIAESLAGLEAVLARASAAGLRCEGVISTSFGCPYEGHVPPERVLEIAARLRDAGAQEIGFGDTTGMANPRQVREFFTVARKQLGQGAQARGEEAEGERAVQLTAHFHNTRGQGLANVLAALQAGVASFESSFGELGGCPVPAGATGNIASEDLVSMLHEVGIETGIDLPALIACARRVQEILGRPLGSHTLVAGPVDWRS